MTVVFSGAARKLTREDYIDDAAKVGCSEAALRAVIEIESSGDGFDKKGRLKALFEPHHFYKHLSGAKRDLAVSKGLAYKDWRPGNYPKDSYPRILEAMAIDETAALKATSWGLPQILGSNHKAAGYDSPQAMLAAFVESEDEQVEAMCRFITAKKLAKHLRNLKTEAGSNAFAKGYNGNAYRKHNYDGRLRAACEKWERKLKGMPADDGILVKAANKQIQEILKSFGYAEIGVCDGDIGGRTKGAIVQFWHDREGVDRPGIIDDALKAEIEQAVGEGWHRPVSAARAEGVPQDDKVVSEAKGLENLGKIAGGIGGAAGLEKAAQQVDAVAGPVNQIKSALEPFKDFIADWWWVGVIAIAAYVVIKGVNIAGHQIGGFRKGAVA